MNGRKLESSLSKLVIPIMHHRIVITFVFFALALCASSGRAQESPAAVQTPRPPGKTAKPAKPSTPEPAPEATPKVWSQRENIKVEPVDVKLARGGKVVISSRAGNIFVTGWDKDTVQASASSDSGPEPVEVHATGDAAHPRVLLTASNPSARRFGREVRLEVKVPRYSDIETLDGQRGDIVISDVEGTTVINTGNGDVKVMRAGPLKVSRRSGDLTARDVKGDLTARSFSGEIVVENVTGLVDVASTNGDLTIHNGGGDVRANSAMGVIEIRCAKGRADVASASGSITLTGVGGDADASTASGEVIFTGLLRANGNYRLKSLSGEVLMTIQPDAPGFTATLSTYSGGLNTDFPLKVENPVQRGPINRRLIGQFGNGQAKIALDSFSGTVKIAKGTAATLKTCK